MINHISIGVNDPEKAANVVAEIWNGYSMPFPVSPNSYIVFADDNRGTEIEFAPINIEIVPGKGMPPAENFSIETPTDEYEATFQIGENSPKYTSVHLAINSPLGEEEIKAIAAREGWRCLTANRGGGLFQLIEFWLEDRFMLEVFTPEMTKRYVQVIKPQNWANLLHIPLPDRPAAARNLSLVG
jgi:hypothetical protein